MATAVIPSTSGRFWILMVSIRDRALRCPLRSRSVANGKCCAIGALSSWKAPLRYDQTLGELGLPGMPSGELACELQPESGRGGGIHRFPLLRTMVHRQRDRLLEIGRTEGRS